VAVAVVAKRKLWRIHGGVSKGAQAYEQIKQAILHAQFRPGEVLSIRTLAASFGISTMPVREAVTRLITEKALELLPNRGLRVPNLTDDEARDVLRARFVLEGLAVELAAARITNADIARLEECERESEDALERGQTHKGVKASLQFHLMLYRASGSQTLVDLIEALYLRYAPKVYTNMLLLPAGRGVRARFVHDHHSVIIAALRKRDKKAARRALEKDMKDTWNLERFETSGLF
jgi:DNA-binding GntR family transcriptional regulator